MIEEPKMQEEKAGEQPGKIEEQSGMAENRADEVQEQPDKTQAQSGEALTEELPGILPEGEPLYEVEGPMNASALYD